MVFVEPIEHHEAGADDVKDRGIARYTFIGILSFFGLFILLYGSFLAATGGPVGHFADKAFTAIMCFASIGVDRYLRRP